MANPFLAELAGTTSETCNLTEPDGVEMVYVARFVSAKFVPIHMPIGSRIPMYCTSAGRAYLSVLPEAEARALLRSARTQGYATNREELFLGDMAIGAPVIAAHGQPVAAVHVVAPTSRWSLEEATQRLAPAVLECARAISNSARALG